MSGIRIQSIQVQDIHRFAQEYSASLSPGDIAPVSLFRSLAWTKNPCALPNDICLLVAFVKEKCVGYLGLLPAEIIIDNRIDRVFWFSTFYVPPEYRSSGVGALLMMRAMSLRISLAVSNYSPQAALLYEKFKFHKVEQLRYFEFDLQQANLPIRTLRKGLRLINTDLANYFEHKGGVGLLPVRMMLYRFLLSGWNSRYQHYKTLQADQLNDQLFDSLQNAAQSVRFYRGNDVINWMLSNQWVTTHHSESTPNHYFCDYREHFEYRLITFENSAAGSKGFVIFWLTRDRGRSNVHVLDHYLSDKDDYSFLVGLTIEIAHAFAADRICLPANFAEVIQHSQLLRKMFKERSRVYSLHFVPDSPAATAVNRLYLDYCDGDVVFA